MRFTRECRRTIAVIFVCLAMPCVASASGWNDYDFDLPYGYYVLRANALDVHIWRKKEYGLLDAVTSRPGVGPLFELAMDKHFIFAKNWGLSPDERKASERVFWTIIDGPQHIVYGPFPEADFQRKVAELGISQPIAWNSLEKAYKEAIRDGRADPSQLNVALQGNILFWGFSWILLTPVFILIAVPAAFVIRRVMGWKFVRSFISAWLAVTVIPFACFAILLVLRWVYMRYL